jgi:hypothetical protein
MIRVDHIPDRSIDTCDCEAVPDIMQKIHIRITGLMVLAVVISTFIVGVYAALIPCGTTMYDPATQTCCQGQVFDDKDRKSVV